MFQSLPSPCPPAVPGWVARLRGWMLMALLLLVAALPARAQDHITDRAWAEDPSGQLGLEQVQSLPMHPFSGVLSRGFGKSVLWLRLRLDPHAAGDGPDTSGALALRIRPVYLDSIQVFDPQAAQPLLATTGDRTHPRLEVLQERDFLVPVARGATARDLWLRLESTSTRQIHVEALDLKDLTRINLQETLVVGLYVGIVVLMMLWGLSAWALHREPLMGAFAFKELAALLFGLTSLGILRAFWPPGWDASLLDTLGSVFSVLTVTGSVMFHRRFLSEFRPARWASRLLTGLAWLCILALALLAVGWTMPALLLNMAVLVLGSTIGLACSLSCQAWSDPLPARRPALPRALVIGFYALIVLFMSIAGMSGLAIMQGSVTAVYVSQIHSLVTGVLVMLMLQYRNHVLRQQRGAALIALERSALNAQHDRQLREEQERLLAMLAHEIKTPLATMHMRLDTQSPGSREIRQAIADMNGVIERCMQAVQMGEGKLQAHVRDHDLPGIVRDAVSACSQPQRVQLDLPQKLAAQTDKQLVFIILNNLLDNACKYSLADSPIVVSLQGPSGDAQPAQVHLSVSNQPGAAGLPDRQRVFSKYYRAPHAKRQAGTGLGLYLVRSLASTLGGRIEYEPDGGAVRFVLSLPQAPQPAA